jgi:hypothetical protein
MEGFILGGLALLGLFVVGVVILTGGLVLWLVTLPFRLLGLALGAVACGVKCLLFLPFLCLGLCALLLAAPFILLALAVL